MLFSEPKIPQFDLSIRLSPFCVKFQCSSASRKFLNMRRAEVFPPRGTCFSALQRAENSSMSSRKIAAKSRKLFQCSSASRKFLNHRRPNTRSSTIWSFSALQRAENSSIRAIRIVRRSALGFSALQRAENSSISARMSDPAPVTAFQCSSASRKFLNIFSRLYC